MSNTRACFYLSMIWLCGVGSCLGAQYVGHVYRMAQACAATQCEMLQDTKTDVKNIPPPALTKKG